MAAKAKLRILLTCFIASLMGGAVLVSGCDNKSVFTADNIEPSAAKAPNSMPQPSGGFTLAIGDETLTARQVVQPVVERFKPYAANISYQQFSARIRPQIEQLVTSKVTDILLYQQAKRDLGVDMEERLDKAANAEIQKFIDQHGGNYAEAEQALAERAMDWESFREYQRKRILSQSFIASQIPQQRPITYSDLLKEYEKQKEKYRVEPMIKFRLIDIRPDRIDANDPNISPLEKARQLAENIRARLDHGADFSKLARKYSHGHEAARGGLWKEVNPASLAQPYDVLAQKAADMAVGELAGPFEASDHIFIMKLEDRRRPGYKPFEQVQAELEQHILRQRRMEAINRIAQKITEKTAIAKKRRFVDYCVYRLYQMASG